MPPQTQRRRQVGAPDGGDSLRRQQQSRRQEDSGNSGEEDLDEDGDMDMDGAASGDDSQLIKKLVRYALACEYARIPIKRDGIREKVVVSNSRTFKRIFDGAQLQLRQVFGMELAELPLREKRTLKEKQKASATQRKASQGAASSRQYILVSILPNAYKSPQIMSPSRAPSANAEGEYVGFYTFVISLIVLCGGELSDAQLSRYLARMNAERNLPMDSTQNVLAKLVRQGYLDKVVDKVDGADENSITWHIGTRAKLELPPEAIAGFVKKVFGKVEDEADFNKKLYKSLGLAGRPDLEADEDEIAAEAMTQ